MKETKKKEPATTLTPEQLTEGLSVLSKAVETIAGSVGTLTESSKETTAGLNTLTEQLSTRINAKPAPAPKDDKDVDLEQMDREGFLKHIISGVNSEMKKNFFDPISERMDKLGSSVSNTDLKDEIRVVAGNHDDFKLYKEDIMNLAKDKPNHSVEDLYILAKNADPDKGKDDNDTNSGGEAEKKKVVDNLDPFGGLTPTSGSTSETSGEMSVDEAANNAWEDTMDNLENTS